MKTTNDEISKKLKEIGFEAENDFYWVKWNEGLPELVHKSEIMPALIEKVPAYDLETLTNALPKTYDKGDLKIWYYEDGVFILYQDREGFVKKSICVITPQKNKKTNL